MKILSVNKFNSAPQFRASVSKNVLRELDIKAQEIQKKQLEKIAAAAETVTIGGMLVHLNEIFNAHGFTYISEKDGSLNLAAGYNGGYYTIDAEKPLVSKGIEEKESIKLRVAKLLIHESSSLGGLLQYKNCVEDLKRQDLIQKGLKIHTYKLNTTLSEKQKYIAVRQLSGYMNKIINVKDLFFIDSDAFYYNRYNKTIYGVNIKEKNESGINSVFKECRFETDKHGNVVGYTEKHWDSYFRKPVEETYKEQTEPSNKLNSIVDGYNNQDLAQAFRFGNNVHDFRIRRAGPEIINHLENRVKIAYPHTDDIQYIKFYDKNKEVVTRFGYYDSSTGRSFIYDERGKYLYQMEYNRDAFGKIIACSRL